MRATEELRRMLNERGVKWRSKYLNKTMWRTGTDGRYTFYQAWCTSDNTLTLTIEYIYDLTPEQVIEAAFGRKTCMPVDGYDNEGEEIGEVCSECGEPWLYYNVNYCPSCGSKVVVR